MADNEEINEQFKSSIKAIEALQSTIGKLSGLQSTQEQSSQSLITASEKLNELTDSLSAATPEIQETLVSVSESLDTAQKFLAETDLTEILKEIAELKTGQTGISSQIEKLLTEINQLKTEVIETQTGISNQNEELLTEINQLKTESIEASRVAEERRETAEIALADLQAKISTLNDRQKKKLGM